MGPDWFSLLHQFPRQIFSSEKLEPVIIHLRTCNLFFKGTQPGSSRESAGRHQPHALPVVSRDKVGGVRDGGKGHSFTQQAFIKHLTPGSMLGVPTRAASGHFDAALLNVRDL